MENKEDPYNDVPEDVKYFYNQFNKNHPNYHKGVDTKVPYNEIKIPDSMPNEFPEGYDPNVVVKDITEGDEISQKIKDSISFYNEFKLTNNKLSTLLIKRKLFIEKSEKKEIKCMSKGLREQINLLKECIEKGKLNKEVSFPNDLIEKFFEDIEKMGIEIKNIDLMANAITNINREMFKNYNTQIQKLKERKKELSK